MRSWERVATIPHLHRVLSLWFQGSSGLVFGDYRSLDDLLDDPVHSNANKEAIILRATPHSWTKVYSGRGEVHAVCSAGSQGLRALGTRFSPSGAEKSFLLASDDLGERWTEVAGALPPGGIGMHFSAPSSGFLWSQDRVYHTSDGGATWVDLGVDIRASIDVQRPALDAAGTLWALADGFLVIVPPEGDVVEEALPSDFDAQLVTAREGKVWLLGRTKRGKGNARILERAGSGALRIAADLPSLSPSAFDAGEAVAVVVGADVSGFAPKTVVLTSRDGLQRWTEVSSSSLNAGPIHIEKDRAVWVYGGADQIFRHALDG